MTTSDFLKCWYLKKCRDLAPSDVKSINILDTTKACQVALPQKSVSKYMENSDLNETDSSDQAEGNEMFNF